MSGGPWRRGDTGRENAAEAHPARTCRRQPREAPLGSLAWSPAPVCSPPWPQWATSPPSGLSATALAGLAGLLAGGPSPSAIPFPRSDRGARRRDDAGVRADGAGASLGWAAGTIVFAGATAMALALDPTARRRLGGPAASAAVSGAVAGAPASWRTEGERARRLPQARPQRRTGCARAALPQQSTLTSPRAARPRRARSPRRSHPPSARRPPSSSSSSGSGRRAPTSRWPAARAIVLYARSTRRAIGAMRLALTDPLTALPRQPSSLPGGAATNRRSCAAASASSRCSWSTSTTSGGQRPLRPPGGGRGAGRSRRAAARWRRGVPARRRRVRRADARRRGCRRGRSGRSRGDLPLRTQPPHGRGRATASIGVATVSDANAIDGTSLRTVAYRAKEEGRTASRSTRTAPPPRSQPRSTARAAAARALLACTRPKAARSDGGRDGRAERRPRSSSAYAPSGALERRRLYRRSRRLAWR